MKTVAEPKRPALLKELVDVRSLEKKITSLKVHFRVRKSPLRFRIMSQINPVPVFPFTFFKV
jgi:hypothetical protein